MSAYQIVRGERWERKRTSRRLDRTAARVVLAGAWLIMILETFVPCESEQSESINDKNSYRPPDAITRTAGSGSDSDGRKWQVVCRPRTVILPLRSNAKPSR